jgi:hypothetical protein
MPWNTCRVQTFLAAAECNHSGVDVLHLNTIAGSARCEVMVIAKSYVWGRSGGTHTSYYHDIARHKIF